MSRMEQEHQLANDSPDSIIRDFSFLEWTPKKDKAEKQAKQLAKAGFEVGIETKEKQWKEDKEQYRIIYWET